jgi:hypothetical protein
MTVTESKDTGKVMSRSDITIIMVQ